MTAPNDPTETLRRQEFDDLQNEIAGRETGRQARFLPGRSKVSEQERKKREARAFQTQLELLMQDPIYRAKYEKVMDTLRDAERATEAALARLDGLIEEAQSTLRYMEDRAARLPDGTRVFSDADGIVRRKDGSVVEDELAETILWRGDEPSYEDWIAGRTRLDELEEQRQDAEGFQNDVLGSARDRMEDVDNPPSLDELDGLLNNIQSQMPANVAAEMATDMPTADIPTASSQIAVPKITG